MNWFRCLLGHNFIEPSPGWQKCRKCKRVWEHTGEFVGCLGEGIPIRQWTERTQADLVRHLVKISNDF
jgi:hypothetical protein